MKSHLNIEVDGKPLTLPEDFTMSIEENNPLFNDTEMFSYPVEIPFEGNRNIIGNIEDENSDIRTMSFEKKSAQINIEGIPFRNGTIVIQEDEELSDSLSVNIDAAKQSFDDLIGDLKCRDVPVKDEILIGEKIGNVHAEVHYKLTFLVQDGNVKPTNYDFNDLVGFSEIEPQALGFSYPGRCAEVSGSRGVAEVESVRSYPNNKKVNIPKEIESYINVTEPYPVKKYCNARVCYKHYGLNSDGTTSDSTIAEEDSENMYEDRYPYWVLDAKRPQSGICFYVLYFLECLFSHLGLSYDLSALTSIGDFNRLCFFTTACKYTTKVLYGTTQNHYLRSRDEINNWLESRGCGGKLEIENTIDNHTVNSFKISKDGQETEIKVGENKVRRIVLQTRILTKRLLANVLAMYASSDNFPDEDVSTVLSSLENSFGIKFHYDYQRKHVTAYLMRKVFRDQSTPIHFPCEILSVNRITEKITGVRMIYSAESDFQEQRDNIRNGVKDYDTDYDYIEYPEDRTVTNRVYADIVQNLSPSDMNVYIDKTTGNAYRIKIDSEATTAAEMRPALFEVGTFKGVEIGDCSTENESFVMEFSSDFRPLVLNDVNYKKTGSDSNIIVEGTWPGGDGVFYASNFSYDNQPILSAFIDEDMEHEFVEQRIRNVISTPFADFYCTEILSIVESYDPSGTDDGNSPLQEYDWGLSIAVMRGGGSDANIQVFDYNYDGFNNSRWATVPSEYALTFDTMDMRGNQFDYNGVLSGLGDEERFSLKIRAYKQPEWASEPLCNPDIVDAQTQKIITKIRSRGLFDSFMREYAHFLLNRKLYRIKVLASIAFLADIPNHWHKRFRIGDKIGYINKLSYDVSVKDGIREVEIDFFTV